MGTTSGHHVVRSYGSPGRPGPGLATSWPPVLSALGTAGYARGNANDIGESASVGIHIPWDMGCRVDTAGSCQDGSAPDSKTFIPGMLPCSS